MAEISSVEHVYEGVPSRGEQAFSGAGPVTGDPKCIRMPCRSDRKPKLLHWAC